MRPTVGAHGFCAQHAVGAVYAFLNSARQCALVKTWPTATRVKLGAVIKQQCVTANTVVVPFGPMVFIAASECTFGGGLASDFIGQGFGIFASKQIAPLLWGFIGLCHEEQLTEMVEAQSGGKAA